MLVPLNGYIGCLVSSVCLRDLDYHAVGSTRSQIGETAGIVNDQLRTLTQVVSNGEHNPLPQTDRQRLLEPRVAKFGDDVARFAEEHWNPLMLEEFASSRSASNCQPRPAKNRHIEDASNGWFWP